MTINFNKKQFSIISFFFSIKQKSFLPIHVSIPQPNTHEGKLKYFLFHHFSIPTIFYPHTFSSPTKPLENSS